MHPIEKHRKRCRRWNTAGEAHEFTFSCLQRRPLLLKERTRQWFARAVIEAAKSHEFDVWAYVVMPEHVHLLVWPRQPEYSASAILKSIKQSVGRKAVNWLRTNNPAGLACLATGHADPLYSFWLNGGGYDRNIRERETLREAIEYIHANPVKRGLVTRPGDWLWSSWRDWHLGIPGPIPIARQSCAEALA